MPIDVEVRLIHGDGSLGLLGGCSCNTGRRVERRETCLEGRGLATRVRPVDPVASPGPSPLMTRPRLDLTRAQILAHRRTVGALNERLPRGARSLRRAAWAGLQDSMPRAALLSIHARVEGTGPSTWEDASLVQLWGPRYHAYVVPAADLAVFSLGRLPDDPRGRSVAEDAAARLHAVLAGQRLTDREAGEAVGVNPNWFRYGSSTGTVLMRWEGARAPVVWTVPPPNVDPHEARLELARRLRPHLRACHARGIRPMGGNLVECRPRGVRGTHRVADIGPNTDRQRVDPVRRRRDLPRRASATGSRAAPTERRRVLPRAGSRSGPAGARNRTSSHLVDPARLAGRPPRGRGDCRDVAPRALEPHPRAVAAPFTDGTRCGGG